MRFLSALLVIGLFAAPSAAAAQLVQRTIATVLASCDADPHRDLRGVLVSVSGRTVAERYFAGATPATLHDIRSAGKSITSALVGIAVDRKLIDSVDAPAFPLAGVERPAGEQSPRMRDLLTMRSGLAADDQDPASPGGEERMDASPSWTAFVARLPLSRRPGTAYVYNSATAFLAGAAVEGASGERLDRFAQRHLFAPLGITRFEWRTGPDGRTAGQGNLKLTLRDMAKVGELYLNGGTYRGRRVISRSWVEASLAPIVPIGASDRYADHYGYMWYSKAYQVNGKRLRVHFASGNGGNKIYIVPSLDVVVAITSTAYGQPRGQKRSEQILLRVLDAATKAQRS
jgi:CubicO group peptidase (beta-lactamase class C family)